MDELEISGKRYISARRAGKENRYHSDYIGQLVRAGKVEGTKVGRAWYVSAESLAAYLNKENEQKGVAVEVAPVATPVQEKVVAVVVEKKEDPIVARASIEVAPVVHAPVASSAHSVPHIKVPKDEAEEETQIPIKKVGLQYIPDDEPLLPQIQSGAKTESRPTLEAYRTAPIAHHPIVPVKKSRSRARIAISLALIFILGSAVALLGIGTALVKNTVTIEGGKAASVGFSLQ